MNFPMIKAIPFLPLLLAMAAPAAGGIIVSGELYTIDGDGDGALDDSSIDRVYFDVTAGAEVNFDLLAWEARFLPVDLNGDGEFTAFDSRLLLFDAGTDTLLVNNDDGPLGADGSFFSVDSNFTYTFGSAGSYFVAIADVFATEADALGGINLNNSGHWASLSGGFPVEPDHADWQLTLNVNSGSISNVRVESLSQAAVPEPASLLIFAGVFLSGAAAYTRRRRGRNSNNPETEIP